MVYDNLDATQTNVLTQYAKAINIGGAQTVVQAAYQENTAAGPGRCLQLPLLCKSCDQNQVARQPLLLVMSMQCNVLKLQVLPERVVFTSSKLRSQPLAGVGKSKVTFNNVDAYQKNALQQVAFALNFAGSQTVIQNGSQSNNAGRRLLSEALHLLACVRLHRLSASF